jgi:hypothetical protein
MALGPMVAMIGAFAAGVANLSAPYPLDGAEARKAVRAACHASLHTTLHMRKAP